MKIVLTGGPCAGKTSMIQVFGRVFASQAVVLPEVASLLFSGGFPRWEEPLAARAVQRAIYHVQCELEAAYMCHHDGQSLIMDRGTLDGAAYWSGGEEDFFRGMGTSLKREIQRYDHVIYLESADEKSYNDNKFKNPARIESWEVARHLDQLTQNIWSRHPSYTFIPNHHSFDVKLIMALNLVRNLLIQQGSEIGAA